MTASGTADPSPALAPALQLLRAGTRVLILAHRNPDADALGSALALSLGLRRLGATTWVAFDDPQYLPANLTCLPGSSDVLCADEWFAGERETPDLVVTVDCASVDRIGRFGAFVRSDVPVLVVDHHSSNRGFGDVDLIDPAADATTVLVESLLRELGVELDQQIATLLYAGLATDTGSFRRASARSLRTAAQYVEAGVDGDAILRALSASHPFGYLKALAAALDRAVLVPEAAQHRGLVHTSVTLHDLRDAAPEDAEAVIDVVRSAQGAAAAAVFKEQSDGTWQISLRGTPDVRVDVAAERFGGGGHRYAAGGSWAGSYAEGIDLLISVLG